MTEAAAPKSQKAYNLNVTPLTAVDTTPTTNGTKKIKFRGSFVQAGRTVERTVVAQGAAADLIEGKIETGNVIALRCVYNRAPGADGKKGGEFLAVVALPLPPKAKAA